MGYYMVNVGPNHYVLANQVVAILDMGTLPVKRIYEQAKKDGRLIDVTHGKKTKTLLMMRNGLVVCSALRSRTLAKRFNQIRVDCDSTEGGDA